VSDTSENFNLTVSTLTVSTLLLESAQRLLSCILLLETGFEIPAQPQRVTGGAFGCLIILFYLSKP